MQAQARPGPAGPGQGNTALQPPLAPSIPLSHVNALLPRLTMAIRDIDAFQTLIAQGNVDGSLPEWDKLLERYTIILSRVQALQQSLAASLQPFSALITPLNPIPPAQSNGMTTDTYFNTLNTLPLIPLSAHYDALLDTSPSLAGASEAQLHDRLQSLRRRAEGERNRGRGVSEAFKRGMEDMVWDMRIGDEGDEGDEDKDGDEDDLFGEDEGDGEKEGAGAKREVKPNPRPGWTLGHYVQYMETGKAPVLA